MEHPEVNTPLKQAWVRFALYDFNAIRLQREFNRLLWLMLVLGALGTALALVQTQLKLFAQPPNPQRLTRWIDFLHYPIVFIPVATSVLLAVANRFKPGKKWVILRGSAEAIKREIFSYRIGANIYSDLQVKQGTKESVLAKQIEDINHQLMQTEVNSIGLRPYTGPIPPKMVSTSTTDDGLTPLSPDQYVTARIIDQLNYYEIKTNKLEKRLRFTQWTIFILGGVGTLLAALGVELWVALTTTLMGMMATYIGLHNVENTLVQYNRTATDLFNIRNWWMALSDAERAEQSKIDNLVLYTEKILEGELVGWVQHMQDALAELRHPQKATDSTHVIHFECPPRVANKD
ncbi:MAG TPA: DUF4231 domain-containing protein [Pyrinomonadaceae bacterium]|nr:DUF4231 domain-containing protein [Pyrinomonadaceae bacterium]